MSLTLKRVKTTRNKPTTNKMMPGAASDKLLSAMPSAENVHVVPPVIPDRNSMQPRIMDQDPTARPKIE